MPTLKWGAEVEAEEGSMPSELCVSIQR